ncbi:transposase [Sphingomonas japonica]|uniref:Transposase n=1 Tax=Sphingomonas japonica TaxID=511662 RepID=A0ABX0TYY8_9SPHN|nr:transposase [Sphingomonas japonica]NIJ22534.1 putative transposase [Sphingomonas japonica]
MKQKQFSEEQIIGILKEAGEGAEVTELVRKLGMFSAIYYAWKAKSGGWRCPVRSGCGRSKGETHGLGACRRIRCSTTRVGPEGQRSRRSAVKKVVTPAAKGQADAHLQVTLGSRTTARKRIGCTARRASRPGADRHESAWFRVLHYRR